jgi:hypothetical protein
MNGNTAHRFLHWERLAFRQCLRRRDLLPPCGGAGTIARGDGQAGPAEPERLLESVVVKRQARRDFDDM